MEWLFAGIGFVLGAAAVQAYQKWGPPAVKQREESGKYKITGTVMLGPVVRTGMTSIRVPFEVFPNYSAGDLEESQYDMRAATFGGSSPPPSWDDCPLVGTESPLDMGMSSSSDDRVVVYAAIRRKSPPSETLVPPYGGSSSSSENAPEPTVLP